MAKPMKSAPTSPIPAARRRLPFLALVVAGMLLFGAATLHAEVFTVVLENGQAFDTRYRPIDAEWDSEVAMILTDQGNWIALDKADIVDITSTIESSGFGYRIDATTVVVGWTYNDGDLPDEGEQIDQALTGGAGGVSRDGAVSIGAAGVPSQAATESGAPSTTFTIDQFVNTDAAGDSGGIPVDSIVYQ